MPEHVDIALGKRHPAHNWAYANAAARTGATGFVAGDVGKLALQTDSNTIWLLTATTPTWIQVGGTLGANLNAGSFKIVSLGTPTSADDAATKAYVDASAGNAEGVQDIVGGMLDDSAEIDFTYDDSGGTFTASLIAGSVAASKLTSDARESTINFVIDGGGAAITTGIRGDLVVDFACTILAVTLLSDQSGSIVVDIWRDAYANYPPTAADSITAAAKPTISGAVKSQDATLTGWTTFIAAGDTLRFNVDSATTCQRVTVALKIRRN